MEKAFDIIVIGAGIAGASLAAALAGRHRVLLLERESRPGHHTTGRSAALFTETYGNAAIRALTAAGRAFFERPPRGFCSARLWRPIDTFLIASAPQLERLEALHGQLRGTAGVSRVDGAEYGRHMPLLRPGAVVAALHDTNSRELDVEALHQGYLRAATAAGAEMRLRAPVTGLARAAPGWQVETGAGVFGAEIVVNAAGAWAEEVAALAGAVPQGVQPLRRTVCVVPAPEGVATGSWPMSVDVEERFYFKPESGGILCSPADETPTPPCDAQPEELDIAIAIDRVQGVIELPVRRLVAKWAGLRSFAPDRSPVVGFDSRAEGFFWFAGQGGYGIQTAPGMAAAGAALIAGGDLPAELLARGLRAGTLAPGRTGPRGGAGSGQGPGQGAVPGAGP